MYWFKEAWFIPNELDGAWARSASFFRSDRPFLQDFRSLGLFSYWLLSGHSAHT